MSHCGYSALDEIQPNIYTTVALRLPALTLHVCTQAYSRGFLYSCRQDHIVKLHCPLEIETLIRIVLCHKDLPHRHSVKS